MAASLLVIAVMAAVKDGRVLKEIGLVGSCSAVAAPAGQTGYWHACKPGKLEGPPNLSRKSCARAGRAGSSEVWRCPTALGGYEDAAGRS